MDTTCLRHFKVNYRDSSPGKLMMIRVAWTSSFQLTRGRGGSLQSHSDWIERIAGCIIYLLAPF